MIETKYTKSFELAQATEAETYKKSVNGDIDLVDGKLIVTSSFVEAGYEVANEIGVAVVKGVNKTAKTTGNVAAGTVRVAGAVTSVVIKSSVPVVGALGTVVVTTGATAVNAVLDVGGELAHVWKEDASVKQAKDGVSDAYTSIKNAIPKRFKLGNFEVRF